MFAEFIDFLDDPLKLVVKGACALSDVLRITVLFLDLPESVNNALEDEITSLKTTGESCSPAELCRIQQGERRPENLKKKHNWRALVATAKYELKVIDKRLGNVRPLTAEEDNCLLELTYQSWDHIFRLAVDGTEA